MGLTDKFHSLSAPEYGRSLFVIISHSSSAIAASNFSFEWEIHAAHHHFMAATSYDKLRFFKFFPADDSFMGSFRNVLLPFWNNANDFLAGNQPLTFSKNHRSGVHIRRENLPDASAVPKYHRGNRVSRFFSIRLMLPVINARHRSSFIIQRHCYFSRPQSQNRKVKNTTDNFRR